MTRGHDLADTIDAAMYPIDLAHEFTHAAFAIAFGGTFDIVRRHDGRLGIDIEFGTDPSDLALVVTAVAPTIVGLMLSIAMFDGLQAALFGESGLVNGLVTVVSFSLLLRYAWPSFADLAVPGAVASSILDGPSTVRRHEVALLIGTMIVASVTVYSVVDGSVFSWAWYHLIGVAGVAFVAFYIFEEWCRITVSA